MRSLRLVPYWSVHETLGVDAHNAPLKMRTRRIHLSVRSLGVAFVATRAWCGRGALRVFTRWPRPLGGHSRPDIPSVKATERR